MQHKQHDKQRQRPLDDQPDCDDAITLLEFIRAGKAANIPTWKADSNGGRLLLQLESAGLVRLDRDSCYGEQVLILGRCR